MGQERDVRHEVHGAGHEVQGARYKVHGAGHEMLDEARGARTGSRDHVAKVE